MAEAQVAGGQGGAAGAVVEGEQEAAGQRRERGGGQQGRVQGVDQGAQRRAAGQAGQRAGGDVAGAVVLGRGKQAGGGGRGGEGVPVGGAQAAELDVAAGGDVDAVVAEVPGQGGQGPPARGGGVTAGQADTRDQAVAGRVQRQDSRAGIERRRHAGTPLDQDETLATIPRGRGADGYMPVKLGLLDARPPVGESRQHTAASEEDRCESGAVPPLSPGSKPRFGHGPRGGGKTGVRADPGSQETPAAVTDDRGADPEEVAWSQTGLTRAR